MATYEPERTRNFYLLGDSQAEMVQLIETDLLPLWMSGRRLLQHLQKTPRLQIAFQVEAQQAMQHGL